MGERPIRVLHVPAAVGGHAPGLAAAERELGLESTVVTVEQPPFGYDVDRVLAPPGTPALVRELRRWNEVRRARGFDVVHFNFGSSLLPLAYPPPFSSAPARAYARLVQLRDLALLRRAGKAIFVTYQGDDARQGDVCLEQLELSPAHELGDAYSTPALDRVKRRSIAAFARAADGIFALNPDLMRVLPPHARFLQYASVDPREWRSSPKAATSGTPVVLHAPTDRGTKGTHHVLDAFERLRAEGIDFEPVLVENVTRDEARTMYERADILVDQLLYGWYGGVAVELMALGRPVVAYLREADLHVVPPEMRAELPVVGATPTTIADVLRELLTARRHELPEIGRRSRAFVERWHDPRTVAAEVVAAYERALEGRLR